MATHLCLTFHLLGGWFHGRADQGEPEWPPSPLRAFQAVVRAAGDRGVLSDAGVVAALDWLASLPAPYIVAPRGELGQARRAAVPNNDADILAAAWARGREPAKDPTQLKTLKEFRTRHLRDGSAVHYLWVLSEAEQHALPAHMPPLSMLASHIVALGWGIDLAAGHIQVLSSDEEARLAGERWFAAHDSLGGIPLRVPRSGTLRALMNRHDAFTTRLAQGAYTPPDAMSAFNTVQYRRAYDRPSLPVAAFSLLTPDASAFRAFHAARRGLTVAGLVRGATRRAAEQGGWSGEKIAACILGHGAEDERADHVPGGNRRFAYVPLPSLEQRSDAGPPVVSSIRRVLLCGATHEAADEVSWAQRALSGRELIAVDTGEIVALMAALPRSEPTVRRYLARASEWTTVTPVVLPGFDDPRRYRQRLDRESDAAARRRILQKIDARIDGLLRKSLRQAGWSDQLADCAQLEWRAAGFLPGVDLASRYGTPDHVRAYPRFHVRLIWRDAEGRPIEMPGPICIGAGRFYGLGLFAPVRPRRSE